MVTLYILSYLLVPDQSILGRLIPNNGRLFFNIPRARRSTSWRRNVEGGRLDRCARTKPVEVTRSRRFVHNFSRWCPGKQIARNGGQETRRAWWKSIVRTGLVSHRDRRWRMSVFREPTLFDHRPPIAFLTMFSNSLFLSLSISLSTSATLLRYLDTRRPTVLFRFL